jgi:capsular polysaccharide transport system permease protein
MPIFLQKLNGMRMVMFALFVRELQSRFNDRLGLGWAFFEPFFFIAALSFIRGLISGSHIHGIPIFIFMMIGLLGVQLVTTTMNTVASSISRDKPLYALRQVQPISSLLVAGFLELCIKTGVVALLAIFLLFFEIDYDPDHPILLLCLFFFSLVVRSYIRRYISNCQ